MLTVLEIVAIVLGIITIVILVVGSFIAFDVYRKSKVTMEHLNNFLSSMQHVTKTRESIYGYAEEVGRAMLEIVEFVREIRHVARLFRNKKED